MDRDKILVTAQKLVDKGKLDKAAEEYKKLVAAEPDDTRTWIKLAQLYEKLDRRLDAFDAHAKAGDIYAREGFQLKAIAAWRAALGLDARGQAARELKKRVRESYTRLGLPVPDDLS